MVNRTLALVLALAALCAAPALAQDAERARQLFEAGVAALDDGQHDEAAHHFDESYRLYPRASTACNMALAQERLGQPCEAQRWYRQCAAIDHEGRLQDHANAQAAALDARCRPAAPHDPFVRTPSPPAPSGELHIVETSQPSPAPRTDSADHTLLGLGIASLVLGVGGLGGGIGAALEAQSATAELPSGGGAISPDSPAADSLQRAGLLSDVALGLYIGGGVLAALGVALIIVDLAQPGVFGQRADRDAPRLVFAATPDGAAGALRLRF